MVVGTVGGNGRIVEGGGRGRRAEDGGKRLPDTLWPTHDTGSPDSQPSPDVVGRTDRPPPACVGRRGADYSQPTRTLVTSTASAGGTYREPAGHPRGGQIQSDTANGRAKLPGRTGDAPDKGQHQKDRNRPEAAGLKWVAAVKMARELQKQHRRNWKTNGAIGIRKRTVL